MTEGTTYLIGWTLIEDPKHYICRECGNTAVRNPADPREWGCRNCGMSTHSVALYFVPAFKAFACVRDERHDLLRSILTGRPEPKERPQRDERRIKRILISWSPFAAAHAVRALYRSGHLSSTMDEANIEDAIRIATAAVSGESNEGREFRKRDVDPVQNRPHPQ